MTLIVPWLTTRWGYVKVKFEYLYPCSLLTVFFTLHCEGNGLLFSKLAVVPGGYYLAVFVREGYVCSG